MTLQELEKELIIKALIKTKGIMTKAHKLLYPNNSKSIDSFHKTIHRKHNINPKNYN